MPRGECDSVQIPKRLALRLVAGVRIRGFSGVNEDGFRGRLLVGKFEVISKGKEKRFIGSTDPMAVPLEEFGSSSGKPAKCGRGDF
jgi:hypothetical protein